MHRLEKIVIRGFRGQSRLIELDLKSDANFLIGRNGTGKTTLINLIHAGLSADIVALREATFERIDYIFKRPKHRTKPKITVTRSIGDEGSAKISYKVADSATATPDEYNFWRARRKNNVPSANRVEMVGSFKPSLKERLGAVYQTTWLSLQRGADALSNEDDWEHEARADIDRKLDTLSNDLTRYFSRLDRKVSDQTQLFQKEWFVSFLANDKNIRGADVDRIDELKERAALNSIFDDFSMDAATYTSKLDRHFRLARRAKASFKDNSPPLRDYLVAVDVLRMHSLVEQWQELESVKEAIYAPKIQFETVASEMLFKKSLATNTSNQIIIFNDSGGSIPLDKLSSGEKQLLIFLSETLLQEERPYIFLADEPELSMHIEWQEELVPALLKINPNAQVLFATHSPDVVSTYQNSLFHMEELAE